MKKNQTKWPLITLISYLLVAAVFIYLGSQKANFHIDEIFTYTLSNSWLKGFKLPSDYWLDNNYIQKILTVQNNEKFNYKMVYANQVADVHPPFYYYIIHTISSLFPNLFSKWVGLSVNLVCQLLVMYLIKKLVCRHTHKSALSLVVSLMWGLSVGAMASGMFIRMYHLLTLIVMVLVNLLDKIITKGKLSVKEGFFLGITYLLGCLTHYYFYLIAGILSGLTILILLREKKYKTFSQIVLIGAFSVLLAFWYFPAVSYHVTGTNRGSEVLTNLQNQSFWENLDNYLNFIATDLAFGLKEIIVGVVLLVGLVYLSYRVIKKREYLGFLLLSASLSYLLIVQLVSHYVTARYIYVIYPLLIVSLGLTLNNLKANKWVYLALLGLNLFALNKLPIDHLYADQINSVNKVSNSNETSALVISDAPFKTMKEVDELRSYEAVYTINKKTDAQPKLPSPYRKGQQMVVYLMDEWKSNPEVIQEIKDHYQLSHETILKETKESLVILLSE